MPGMCLENQQVVLPFLLLFALIFLISAPLFYQNLFFLSLGEGTLFGSTVFLRTQGSSPCPFIPFSDPRRCRGRQPSSLSLVGFCGMVEVDESLLFLESPCYSALRSIKLTGLLGKFMKLLLKGQGSLRRVVLCEPYITQNSTNGEGFSGLELSQEGILSFSPTSLPRDTPLQGPESGMLPSHTL